MDFYFLVDDCIVVTSECHGPQRIAYDNIHDSSVSTVFLGMEHLGGMFETLVIGGPVDGYMQRCDTAAQARAVHARIVAALSSVSWLTYHLDGNVETKLLTLLNDANEDI